MPHNIQYIISTLSGAYAQKYSVTILNAQRLEAFIKRLDKDGALDGFATATDKQSFDPFTSFNALMRLLKYLAKYPKKGFCTHIQRKNDAQVCEALSFEDSDEDGPFVLKALSYKGQLERASETHAFVEHQGARGKYKAIRQPLIEVFKDDLMNLLNLCEEAMAKDAQILARRVSGTAPIAPPLFQL